MASIVIAVEALRLPPLPRGAGRQLLIFPREALPLIATLILRSAETAADNGQPDAKLAGLFTSGYLPQRFVHPVFFNIERKWTGRLVKIDQSLRCTRKWRQCALVEAWHLSHSRKSRISRRPHFIFMFV
jgi:hypothetical protein